MSHYKRYPRYKESDVEWLGDVPEHWKAPPLWSVFKPIKRTNNPNQPLLSVYRDHGVVLKDSRDDNKNRASEDLSPYQLVKPGELVTNKMKTWQGSIAISELKGIVSPAYFIYKPLQPIHSRYAHFLLRSLPYISGYNSISKGIRVGQWDLDQEKFRLFPVLVPPTEEQLKIAGTIERETTRIDALIEKKTRFIELLKEKRQALITQAVTKGLDPNVKMKDSGVEWLGEVPEHWVVSKLKRMGRLKGGAGFPPDMQGQTGMPVSFYKVGDLGRSKDGIHLRDAQHTISCEDVMKLGAHVFAPDSLCWAKIGAALSLNRRRLIGTNACLDNNMTGFICDEHVALPRYMLHLMSVVDFSVHAKPGAVPSFSEGDQGELAIPAPSFQEQVVIAEHIDHAISKVDTLVLSVEKSVQLLKERRSALITAAVTGQIDLRDAA